MADELRPEGIKVETEVQVPKVPNFLIHEHGKIRVGDVQDTSLRRIGEAWTEALLERAREQREAEAESVPHETPASP